MCLQNPCINLSESLYALTLAQKCSNYWKTLSRPFTLYILLVLIIPFTSRVILWRLSCEKNYKKKSLKHIYKNRVIKKKKCLKFSPMDQILVSKIPPELPHTLNISWEFPWNLTRFSLTRIFPWILARNFVLLYKILPWRPPALTQGREETIYNPALSSLRTLLYVCIHRVMYYVYFWYCHL